MVEDPHARRTLIGAAAMLLLAGCSEHGKTPPPDAAIPDAAPDAFVPLFLPPTLIPLAPGSRPYFLCVADFDFDGWDDIAVISRVNATLSVLVNKTTPGEATPRFAPPVVLPIGLDATQAVAADFNGDGRVDLAVNNPSQSTVSVLLNTTPLEQEPTASFASRVEFSTGSSPVTVAAGDVDGDGKPDLAVGSFGEAPAPGSVAVLLDRTPVGASTPMFTPMVAVPGGLGVRDVAVVDIDGDGKRDLVTVSSGSSSVMVLVNTTLANPTAASFVVRGPFSTGSQPLAVVAGSFRGGLNADLAVASSGASVISILENTTLAPGAVTFLPSDDRGVGFGPQTLALGSLFGRPFVASANLGSDTISVLHGPDLDIRADLPVGMQVRSIVVGDFNRDGKADVALVGATADAIGVMMGSRSF